MNPQREHDTWRAFTEETLRDVRTILLNIGYTLDDAQPHIGGERFLMRAMTTAHGRKMVLLGKGPKGARVVIKVARDSDGIREIEHERTCRALLHAIRFAYGTFHSPEELYFSMKNGYAIQILEFVEQDMPFLSRPLKEQFDLALRSLKAQEGTRATTSSHFRAIRKTFGVMDAEGYMERLSSFAPPAEVREIFATGIETIDRYGGFLTHTDFVPHNIRIRHNVIYLLDHSSLRFGNKYEGWARFANFMALYNAPLRAALLQYVHDNRAPEESHAFHIMRIYRLTELIAYYRGTLSKSDGNLLELNQARISFWSDALSYEIRNEQLPEHIVLAYTQKRDRLRSEDEKVRQIGLH